jgi:hypothetical protein
MAEVVGARWGIEEEFENGKDIGLDHYEVRSFVGWLRHMTLVLLVLAVLTVICTKERGSSAAREANQTSASPIALTVPEVRRLSCPDSFFLLLAVLPWCWIGPGGVAVNKAARKLLTPNVASTPASGWLDTFFETKRGRSCGEWPFMRSSQAQRVVPPMLVVCLCPCSLGKFPEGVSVVPITFLT